MSRKNTSNTSTNIQIDVNEDMYKTCATLKVKVDSKPFQTSVMCLGYQIPGISSTKQLQYRIGNCTKYFYVM